MRTFVVLSSFVTVVALVGCSGSDSGGSGSSSSCPDNQGGSKSPSPSPSGTATGSKGGHAGGPPPPGAPPAPGESHTMADKPCSGASNAASPGGGGGGGGGADKSSGAGSSSSMAQFGDTCESDDKCATGKCLKVSNNGKTATLCTKKCSQGSDCPKGYACSLIQFQACVPE